jgi:hypothetical protein
MCSSVEREKSIESTERTAEVGETVRATFGTEGSRDEHSSRSITAPSSSGIGSSTMLEEAIAEPNENPA